MQGGSPEHLLGTDAFGRDTFSRLIYGARISLVVSLLAVFFAGSVGTAVGLIAGYFGGWVDVLLMRVVDVGLSIPLILMAIILVSVLGPSITNVILVILLLLWPRYARQIRAETLSIKQQPFVDLARVAGCSPIRIMWVHIFPNVIPSLLVLATLQVGWVIIMESSLSFLGVGIPPPQPAWGVMVADGRGLIATAWWISLWPGLAILLTVLSFNLLGDWLRDRLDPKLRQV
ncbi:Glutathione transport system permease protein GsiD [subsurface metagenome]